jgi:hypothetical protein
MTTYYALINKENNEVVQIIPGVDVDIIQTDIDGKEIGGSARAWEKFYESRPWFEGMYCKITSHDSGERKNRAGIGYTYDQIFDAFIPPSPFPSWKLNYETFLWDAPVAKPENIEGYQWRWSETNKEWIQVAIPSAN